MMLIIIQCSPALSHSPSVVQVFAPRPFLRRPLHLLAFMWQATFHTFKTKTKRKIIFYVCWSRRNIQNWPKS